MIKSLLFSMLLLGVTNLMAIDVNADLFTYDEKKVEHEFAELTKLETVLNESPEASIEELTLKYPEIEKLTNFSGFSLYNNTEILAPGKFPSFWFTFMFSAVGTYFIYGAVAGPISVGIVYFSTHKDKIETKKAFWGCITGTLIGAGIKLVVVNL